MAKFKVGDRVKISEKAYGVPKTFRGNTYEITKVGGDLGDYSLKNGPFVLENELESAEEPPIDEDDLTEDELDQLNDDSLEALMFAAVHHPDIDRAIAFLRVARFISDVE